jgi:hypothetical protein
LQTDEPPLQNATSQPLAIGLLGPVFDAGLRYWHELTGVLSVEVPNGIGGVQAWGLQSPTPNISIDLGEQDTSDKLDWYAGLGQGSFDDQLLLANFGSTYELTSKIGTGLVRLIGADQLSIDSNVPPAANRHTVQAQPDPQLFDTKVISVVDKHVSQIFEANISEGRALVHKITAGISNFYLGFDLSSPSREGAGSDTDVFQLQHLPLDAFSIGSNLFGQVRNVVPVPIIEVTPSLGQSEDQQSQNALPHSLSFGSLTLPPDRKLVNRSVENGQWLMADRPIRTTHH